MTPLTITVDRDTIRERLRHLGVESGTRDGELIVVIEDLTFWIDIDSFDSALRMTTAHPRVLRGESEMLAGQLLASALNTVPDQGVVDLLPDVGILTVSFELAYHGNVELAVVDDFIVQSLSAGVVMNGRMGDELDPLIRKVQEIHRS